MNAVSSFMGYKINNSSLDDLVDLCGKHICMSASRKTPIVFSCANPHSLATAEYRDEFRQALRNAEILVADGVGLTIVGSLLGTNVNPRITGSDFFNALMNSVNNSSYKTKIRVCFFGSNQKVLNLIKKNLADKYHHIEFCDFISPPYGDWDEVQDADFIERINLAKPDILWVGMTAPKQEIWVEKNRAKLQVSVIGNIGAVFDFCAGTYQRAPKWAQQAGIEWLIRLMREPRRMWRRNFVSPIIFVVSALRYTLVKAPEISKGI